MKQYSVSNCVEVNIILPFLIRLEGSFPTQYEDLCSEPRLSELEKWPIHISFSRIPMKINKSKFMHERTKVTISVETPTPLQKESAITFAIRDCLKIINRIILSYQAVTGSWSNAGYISSLGTSDMQLFAEITLNGEDIRDRWPSMSINTFPLFDEEIEEFKIYLSGGKLPLSKLFLTNASLQLERGQYSISVTHSAMSIELGISKYITKKLRLKAKSENYISKYEKKTLGQKLGFKKPDPRSLETYLHHISNFATLHRKLKNELTPLRNNVIHRGHLATREEAIKAVEYAKKFQEFCK